MISYPIALINEKMTQSLVCIVLIKEFLIDVPISISIHIHLSHILIPIRRLGFTIAFSDSTPATKPKPTTSDLVRDASYSNTENIVHMYANQMHTI